MKQTIYLHIGPHKTGTTVIQKASLDNRNILEKYSVTYPDVFFEALGHHKLVDSVRGRKNLSDDFDSLLNSSEKILLSSENFISFSLEDLKYLKTCLSKFDVKIIYAWRRSSLKMYSMWQESIKHGCSKPFYSYFYNDLIRPGESRSLMQKINLDMYASVFGKDNIYILDFDALSDNKSLVTDFFSIVGVDGAEVDVSNQSKGIKNESLDPATIEILRCLNSLSKFAGFPENARTREAFLSNQELVSENIEKAKLLMGDYYEEFAVGDYFIDRVTEKNITEHYSSNLVKYENKSRTKKIRVVKQDWLLKPESSQLITAIHKAIIGG
ncbi:hypothetical protein [Vibrio porteresiae]|uniref:Sulfotransferase domain-containing protein n=1 Tax=Vibrio porteresiae DSM 19223 TaxID=1123496 RepID=A0ABZ0QCV6_9VIBR|nr:hypothetical protein [Vibrio porteresiae]WPC74291.1 hypothetical protein R8Z52_03235 [Vibrio porteresiae DSM 19223]